MERDLKGKSENLDVKFLRDADILRTGRDERSSLKFPESTFYWVVLVVEDKASLLDPCK